MHNVQYTMHSVQYTMHNVQFTLDSVQNVHCTIHNVHCTPYYIIVTVSSDLGVKYIRGMSRNVNEREWTIYMY